MSGPSDTTAVPTEVRARPVVAGRLAVIGAAVVFAAFLTISVVMTTANAGVSFSASDQVATGLIGVLAAAGVLLFARPRLIADHRGLKAKAWAGTYRFIPWDLVQDVQFPPGRRYARVALPGEEYLALYAVQRLDGERAVATMTQLRALHAAVRAETARDRPTPS